MFACLHWAAGEKKCATSPAGLCSLVVARACPTALVVATDGDRKSIELLRENVGASFGGRRAPPFAACGGGGGGGGAGGAAAAAAAAAAAPDGGAAMTARRGGGGGAAASRVHARNGKQDELRSPDGPVVERAADASAKPERAAVDDDAGAAADADADARGGGVRGRGGAADAGGAAAAEPKDDAPPRAAAAGGGDEPDECNLAVRRLVWGQHEVRRGDFGGASSVVWRGVAWRERGRA